MSQADLEKAYTEAVDQLARAVEANRLLTERLEAQELLIGKVRAMFSEDALWSFAYSWHNDSPQQAPYGETYNRGIDAAMEALQTRFEDIDQQQAAAHTQEPPARPGEPT